MTGDQGHGSTSAQWMPPGVPPGHSGPRGGRPGFLPPYTQNEPVSHLPPPRPPRPEKPSGRPGTLAAAGLLAASVLLVSPFLPWVKARLVLRGFGQTLTQDLVAEAGVNVDGSGQVVPVFAALAILMIGWGLLAANRKICALAGVPATLALISCGIFLLRLDRFTTGTGDDGAGFGSYEVTAAYGWFLALAAAILLIGISLLTLVAGRSRPPSAAGSAVESESA